MIFSGNLSGTGPSGPGDLAWLAAKGFAQEQFTASGFGVDVTDSGVDDGTQAPNHFGLYVAGEPPAAAGTLRLFPGDRSAGASWIRSYLAARTRASNSSRASRGRAAHSGGRPSRCGTTFLPRCTSSST